MKSLIATLILMLGSGALLFAADGSNPSTQPSSQPTTQPMNRFCPVQQDEAVDPDTKTVVYKGNTIGFCCDDCIPKFQADPETYMKTIK